MEKQKKRKYKEQDFLLKEKSEEFLNCKKIWNEVFNFTLWWTKHKSNFSFFFLFAKLNITCLNWKEVKIKKFLLLFHLFSKRLINFLSISLISLSFSLSLQLLSVQIVASIREIFRLKFFLLLLQILRKQSFFLFHFMQNAK